MTSGSEPGEFLDLHGLVLDAERDRILVVDRGNSRIQVFDMDWNFREEWPNIYAPYAMRMQTDGDIWIADGFTSKFLRYDLEGRLITSWGQWGIAPGCTWGVHWFDTDTEGNLYVCEVYGERIQKLRKRDDVSPMTRGSSASCTVLMKVVVFGPDREVGVWVGDHIVNPHAVDPASRLTLIGSDRGRATGVGRRTRRGGAGPVWARARAR